MFNMNISKYPENRKKMLVFKSPHNTTIVVNYMADNNYLNTFLATFDIWNGNGNFQLSKDERHCEVCFEMDAGFYEIADTETMKSAFKRFGVEVVFDAINGGN